jgi:hypothetical protein
MLGEPKKQLSLTRAHAALSACGAEKTNSQLMINSMLVISLVAPNAAGKTTLVTLLSSNYQTVSENYVELDQWGLDNSFFASKWTWIGSWFNRVLAAKQNGVDVLITDRAPVEAAAYPEDGHELFRPLLISMKELGSIGINCRIVYLFCDWEVLRNRTAKRLESEPYRRQYREGEAGFNNRLYAFYEAIVRPKASLVLDTSKALPEASRQELIKFIESERRSEDCYSALHK